MRFWSDQKLVTKVALTFALILLVNAIVYGFTISGQNKILEKFSRSSDETMIIVQNLLNAKAEMLMARRHEKDYLARVKDKYVDKHRDSIARLNQLISDSQNLDQAGTIEASTYDDMLSSIANYNTGFSKAVIKVREEGNTKEGVRGELRGVAHQMEKLLNKSNDLNAQGMVYLLTLRRHEKDYLLRRDQKYLAKVNNTGEVFARWVKKKWPKPDDDRLINLSQKYRRVFQSLVDTSEARIEAIASFRKDIHKFEELTENSIKSMSEKSASEILWVENEINLITLMLIIGAAIALIVVLLALKMFHGVVSSIAQVGSGIVDISRSIHGIGKKLNGTSQKVSSAATEQASAVQETVATLNEITAMVQRGVDNANASSKNASQCELIATKGLEGVQKMEESTHKIEDSVNSISTQMIENGEEMNRVLGIIEQISAKTSVINDIVFQTKLLSFNASVEAARAGDDGKGFAVVAEEVGNLAQMSGESAKEISSLIQQSQTQVREIIESSKSKADIMVNEVKERINFGVTLAGDSSDVLNEVVSNVEKVSEMMTDVSLASQEQSEGIHNITIAMNELDKVTSANSGMAEETASYSNSLQEQSETLKNAINKLDRYIYGAKKAVAAEASEELESQDENKEASAYQYDQVPEFKDDDFDGVA